MDATQNEPKIYPCEILTRKELAARLKMSLRGIDLLQSKGLPHFKLGKPSRFIFEDVLEWLKAGNAQSLRHPNNWPNRQTDKISAEPPLL